MKQNDLATILTCSLFNGVDDPGLARDIESLPYRMSSIANGRIVLIRNEPYDELIIVISGVLEAYQEDWNGHHMVVESIRAPEAVATAMLFTPVPRIPVTLKAVEPSRLFQISRPSVLRLCTRYPGVLMRLLNDMGARAAFLADKLRYQVFSSIRQKLAVFLQEQIDLNRYEITVNKEHLAEMFGVNRPSLSRVCKDLNDMNIIRLDGRRIVIVNPGEIRRMTELVIDH